MATIRTINNKRWSAEFNEKPILAYHDGADLVVMDSNTKQPLPADERSSFMALHRWHVASKNAVTTIDPIFTLAERKRQGDIHHE